MRIFALYILCLSILLIINFYFLFISPSDFHRNILLRVFVFIEFSFLAFYFTELMNNSKAKKAIRFFVLPFFILSNYDYIIGSPESYSYIPIVVESIIILCIILFLFYEKMKEEITLPLYKTKSFWISIAFTIFFAGNFFLFLYTTTAQKDANFIFLYSIIYATITILKNLFICIGLSTREDTYKKEILENNDIWEIPSEFQKPNT